MRNIRIFFTKQGEAAYISHLDLQRAMARALRCSGMPVWYSQGFNPHIYMSFALALPLYVESLAEVVDVRSEDEDFTLEQYIQPLDDALPSGIRVLGIAPPKHPASQIARAEYSFHFRQPGFDAHKLAAAYNGLETATVTRKTKRSEGPYDLKHALSSFEATDEATLCGSLPAGQAGSINPLLVLGFLAENLGAERDSALITRRKILTDTGELFC